MNAAEAIRAARAAYNAAIAARDADAIAAFLADDYRLQASNGDELEGRAALLEHWQQKFARDADVLYVRRPSALAVEGATAHERGTWTGHHSDHGARIDGSGHYSAEWRLEDDRWLLVAETFSAR